jgi:glycosyltransferase involved in cell wall biosynthesis
VHDKHLIKVVQFSSATVRAGAEEVALELFRGLDPEKFRTYLICPTPLLEAFGESPSNGRVLGLDLQNPWQWPQNREFMKFLRTERIDVLHAHMTRAALAAVPLARLAGVPVVVQTCHGREAWRQSWASRQFWIDRRVAEWVDATIAVSEAAKNYLLTEKNLDPSKIIVIPNGRNTNGCGLEPADAERLFAELGVAKGSPVVGVFARLEEQKGHRFLLEALSAVKARVGTVTVLLVGDGILRSSLEKSAAELGLAGCVVFTGYRKDALQLMSICDLVVLPSLYEGMPLVPIEAAALGKAVVATSVDGTPEVIVDNVTGVLVPPRDPAALAEGIIRLMLDPGLRRALGERARDRARELFSQERHLRDSAACYERLLEQRSSRSWRNAA